MNSPETIKQPKYYGFDPEHYGDYTFGIERMVDMLPEIRALHQEEVAVTEECWLPWPIEINYFLYIAAEDANKLVVFTIRHKGQIVGNVLYRIGPYANVRGAIGATDSGLYITPAHRKGRLAFALMGYAEKCLRQMNVNYIVHGDKGPSGGPDLDKFFRHCGYTPFAVEYVKVLSPVETKK